MFRASLCPSPGEQDRVLPHMVSCISCAVCGWLWSSGSASWAACTLWRLLFDSTQFTQRTTQLHTTTANHSQHKQCRTPYAVVHGLVLLMMGTMMPETGWDRSLIINIGLVASCWFLSLHPTFMMHSQNNLKLISRILCVASRWTVVNKKSVYFDFIYSFCLEVSYSKKNRVRCDQNCLVVFI